MREHLKKRMRDAGMPATGFGFHSFRSGFLACCLLASQQLFTPETINSFQLEELIKLNNEIKNTIDNTIKRNLNYTDCYKQLFGNIDGVLEKTAIHTGWKPLDKVQFSYVKNTTKA